jgi:hypothetical protein
VIFENGAVKGQGGDAPDAGAEPLIRRAAFLAAVLGSMAMIATLDRSASDDAAMTTLGAILLASGLLGAASPGRASLAGAAIGSTVALVRAVGLVVGLPDSGEHLPAGWAGPASLLVLAVPAVAAARFGGLLRRGITPGDDVPAAS